MKKSWMIVGVCVGLLGCKDSYAPKAKGPAPEAPTTAAESTPDKPGPTPASPRSVSKPSPPSNPAKTPGSAPKPVTPTPSEPSGVSATTVAGLTFTPPNGWIRQPPKSRMRLAQFQLPPAEGDTRAGVMTVIAAGGDIDANIRRWEGQFQGSPTSERAATLVDGKSVLVVEIEGTFMFKARPMAPGPGTPQPGTLLLGAIVKLDGNQLFFKAWGPKATMEKWRAEFDAMVQTFSWKG